MPGISSVSISHAHGIIKFVKRKFPQTILVFPSVSRSKPLYTLFNFTLLSQRKICLILMTEGQEVGVEIMVNYKWVRSEKLWYSPTDPIDR